MEVLEHYFASALMQVILVLVVFDTILGILVALVSKKFRLAKLAYFLHDSFLPYILVFAVVEVISDTNPVWAWLTPGVFVAIVVTLVANIIGNLAKAGLPTPKILKKD